MQNEQNLIEPELIIDSTINIHLKEAAAWGRFLGIIGFIYSGLTTAGAIFAATILSNLSSSYSGGAGGLLAGGSVGVIYLALAGVVFFMSMYLFRFAKNIQVALKNNDQDALTASFNNLKIYFRFAGIITVIALIFTVLGAIGVLIAAAFTRG